ncbi:sigma-70 family RNA polymerase sigma factor [Myxococcota bacterium]|nr:sigma-70 family RNA polymerase sigma factor [Myxococcota bacterium]MBU1536728.1 sigma-70 family RNA polymerase sigma factor [Myxococcota bacterium]
MFGWKKDKSDEFMKLAAPVMDSLYGTALKLTREEEAARDLVQDAYLKAFKYFDTFERGTNFKAWLFRIMTRLFYDAYRAKRRRDSTFMPLEEERAPGNIKDATAGERLLLSKELEAALNELPPDFKLPLVLCDIQEFSYQEIAEVMDVPIGTVMSRLYRARKRLREIIVSQDQIRKPGKSYKGGVVIPL